MTGILQALCHVLGSAVLQGFEGRMQDLRCCMGNSVIRYCCHANSRHQAWWAYAL